MVDTDRVFDPTLLECLQVAVYTRWRQESVDWPLGVWSKVLQDYRVDSSLLVLTKHGNSNTGLSNVGLDCHSCDEHENFFYVQVCSS
jgi:hypothetical protein